MNIATKVYSQLNTEPQIFAYNKQDLLSSSTKEDKKLLTWDQLHLPVRIIQIDEKGEVVRKYAAIKNTPLKTICFLLPTKKEKECPIGKGTYKKVFKMPTLNYNKVQNEKIGLLVTTLFTSTHDYKNRLEVFQRESKIQTKLAGAPNILQKLGEYTYTSTRQKQPCEKYVTITPAATCNLWQYMKVNKHFSEREKYHIMKNTLNGLAEMHRREIMHGDVKPDNILLKLSSGSVFLCDFGNSYEWNSIDDETKSYAILVSTPEYMSPEMFEFCIEYKNKEKLKRITFNRDVWSLGIVFYTLFLSKGAHPLSLIFKKWFDSRQNLYDLTTNHRSKNTKESRHAMNTKQLEHNSNIQSVIDGIKQLTAEYKDETSEDKLVNLINKMLNPNPSTRISAQDVLNELIVIGQALNYESKEISPFTKPIEITQIEQTNSMPHEQPS